MVGGELSIVEVPAEDRKGLLHILDESFEGWYLWHSRRTMRDVELVLEAVLEDSAVGLIMLKEIWEGTGYIYYLAVLPEFRKRGIGGALLDEALTRFSSKGMSSVYASVEEDNMPSLSLLHSKGFMKTDFGDMSRLHGRLTALRVMSRMQTVPGEEVLRKALHSD